MVGGKTATELINCIQYAIDFWNRGSERLFAYCDGALRTYALYKYFAIISHPENPHKEFKSICAGTGTVGHTRLEADGIGNSARKCYNKCAIFTKCSDRVNWLNNNSTVEAKEMTQFFNLSENFQEIFLDTKDWRDNHGDAALIKSVPALQYEFGQSPVWNQDTKRYEWVSHGDEMWARYHMDPKVPCRYFRE